MQTIRSIRFRMAAALCVSIAIGVGLVAARRQPAVEAAMWSGVMLASFVGWGSVVNLWLAPLRRMDVGLRAGWGLALYVLSGGFLCGAHVAVRPVLIAHVGLGVVALIATGVRTTVRRRWWHTLRRRAVLVVARAGLFALLAGACGMTALTFFGFLGYHGFSKSDDLPFYFTLAEKLAQTSSLFEPFAARRIATFGGQVYLHASFISVAPIYYLHAVDGGICFVVVVSLLVGHVARKGFKAWHVAPLGLALLLLFSLEDIRVNTNSQMSGLAAVLTLYRSVRIPFGPDPERPVWPLEPRRTVVLAGLTLACIVLRISNTPAVLAFVAFVIGSDYFLGVNRPWSPDSLRSLLGTAALFAGTLLFAFLPWSILQEQSSGTFFYPFGHSNVTPGWTLLLSPRDWAEEVTQLIEHLFYGKPVSLLLPFAVASLVPLEGRARNDLVALALGTLVGLAAFSHQAAGFGPTNTARYYYASVAAMSLLAAASVERTGPRGALVAVALAMHLVASRDDTRTMMVRYANDAFHALSAKRREESTRERLAFDAPTNDYRSLQGHVPAGATMATAVYESFRFDFKRNRILALDVLGGMGPPPGWPAYQGPEALGAYLRENGVDYLVWVDFDLPNEFYGRAHWAPFVREAQSYLQGEAVLQLDAEGAIEKLSAARRFVYKGHGMTVVDLSAPPD
jgi:hypothetical protein